MKELPSVLSYSESTRVQAATRQSYDLLNQPHLNPIEYSLKPHRVTLLQHAPVKNPTAIDLIEAFNRGYLLSYLDYGNFQNASLPLLKKFPEPISFQSKVKNSLIAAAEPESSIAKPSHRPAIIQILDSVPDHMMKVWSHRRILTPQQMIDEAREFVLYSQAYKNGDIEPIHELMIMERQGSDQITLASEAIRQALVPLTDQDPESYRYHWVRRIRIIQDYLGIDSSSKLRKAFDQLPEVERALAINMSSASFMQDLDYYDAEVCDEKRIATYLRRETYAVRRGFYNSQFNEILEIAIERADAGTLVLGDVVESILEDSKDPSRDLMTLCESAEYEGQEESILELLNSHPATRELAKELNHLVRYGRNWNKKQLSSRIQDDGSYFRSSVRATEDQREIQALIDKITESFER